MAKYFFFCSAFMFAASVHGQQVINQIDPRLPPGEFQMSSEFAERSLKQAQLSFLVSDPFLAELVQLGVNSPESFDGLELLENQKKAIQNALADYEKILDDTNRDLESQQLEGAERKLILREKLGPAKARLSNQIIEVLLPEQIIELVQGKSQQIGFSKRMVDSHLGNWLEVDDKQKEKIIADQKKLHEEMLADLAKYRQRSLDLVIANLSAEQKEKFFGQFDTEKLKTFYGSLQFNELFRQTKPEDPDSSSLKKGTENSKNSIPFNSSMRNIFDSAVPSTTIKIDGK